MPENTSRQVKNFKVENFDIFEASKISSLIALFVIFMFAMLLVFPALFADIVGTLVLLSPFWLPLLLAYIFWKLWVIYVRSYYIKNEKHVVLEIKLPREITKSPLAMEAVLSGLHHGIGERTFLDKYWLGRMRPWFSLEIASIGGEVKFFIWTRAFLKNIVESQIYAQYPGVEIYEAEDYTRFQNYNTKEVGLWGSDFKLSQPDPYPIKTYVDYALEKDPKEEYKVDPLVSLLELFGSIGKGEQFWMQILIRVNKRERKKKGTWFGKAGWKDEARTVINEILKRDPKTKVTTALTATGFPTEARISEGERDIMKAIERSITKLGFDVGIRGIYLAEKDKFNPTNIIGLIGTVKQFNSNTLNKFEPTRWLTIFKNPWQDYKSKRRNRARRRIFDAYRRRSYFYPPYSTPYFVLNTEELATLYHLPGEVAHTPTLSRVPSKKSEAPSDLPI